MVMLVQPVAVFMQHKQMTKSVYVASFVTSMYTVFILNS